MLYFATYAGYVENTSDPEKLGRLKVRVPTVYGPADSQNSISTADIPWALAAGLPAGGSDKSGAIQWLPETGDHVFVRFLDGEPEKPLWEWGGQDVGQAKEFPYWSRSPGGYGTDGSAPTTALLTRYRHSLEFSPDYLMLRTSSGWKIRLNDLSGQLDVYADVLEALIQNTDIKGESLAVAVSSYVNLRAGTQINLDATRISIKSLSNTLSAVTTNNIDAPQVYLGPTSFAIDPVVRLSDLDLVIKALILQFAKHVHIVVSLGKPTLPPMVPLLLIPTGSSTTFTA